MAEKLGKAVLEISLEDKGYHAQIEQARKGARGLGDEVKGIGSKLNLLLFKEFGEIAVRWLGAIIDKVVELGTRGAAVNDVKESFAGLTAGVGSTADVMLGALRKGTLGTVADFDLMQAANRGLGAGLKLTAEDMGTLAAGAKLLADRTGKDTKDAFDALTNAMVTGRTKGLVEFGFAAKDGKAVLGELTAQLEQAGPATADFSDYVDRGRVTVENLKDSLAVVTASVLPDLIGQFRNLSFGATSLSDSLKVAMNFVANAIVNTVGVGVNAITGLVQAMTSAATTIGSQASQMWGILTGEVGVREGLANIFALGTGGLAAIREGLTAALNPTLTWKDYLVATGEATTMLAGTTTAAADAIVTADARVLLSKQWLAQQMHDIGAQELAFQQTADAAMLALMQQSLAAQAAAQGAYAVQTMTMASQAGFKTREELEATAKKAVETHQRMLESGLYTAATLKAAWDAAEKAKQDASEKTTKFGIEQGLALADASSMILRGLFGKNKAAAIAAAVIDTAAAVVSSFRNAGGWPWGLIPAAAMLAAGMKQIATIKSQNAGFAEGTPDLDFAGFGAVSDVQLHGQEAVIPRGGGHQLAGEIAAAMPGGDGELLRSIDYHLERLPFAMRRAFRDAMRTA